MTRAAETIGERAVDVAIIGGGVIGLALAWRLSLAGARLRLIADGAAMASRAAAGMLAGSFEAPYSSGDRFLFDFSRAALAEWRPFAARLADDVGKAGAIDYRDDGIIGVADDEKGALYFEKAAADLAALGAPARYLGPDALSEREPALAASVTGGMLVADEGQVDPRLLVSRLEALLAARDPKARIFSRAVGIEGRDGGPSPRGRLLVACANGEAIAAERVVIATGAARGLVPQIPITPVKGEALSLRPAAGLAPRRVIRGPGAYLCPKADGRLVIGASEVRGAEDLAPDAAAIAALRAAAERLVPGLQGAPEVERWAGVRPGTPDGLPVIGPAVGHDDRALFALGHYRNGVLWAALTARLLADALTGGSPHALSSEAFAAFSPARFNQARAGRRPVRTSLTLFGA